MGTNATVHTGYWVDYSKGSIRGPKITLHSGQANILIAFLAVFITTTGTQLWSIFCFWIHQVRSDEHARDGLYHQRQAVLRNVGSPFSTLVYLYKMGWAWRSSAAQTWTRQLPLIMLTLAHIGLFAAAAVLAPHVATTGTDGKVLLRGEDVCDWWFSSNNTASLASFWAIQQPVLQESSAYARACYQNETDLNDDRNCKIFSTPRINFDTQIHAPCPFPDNRFCRSSSEGAVHLASEMINSNSHLGVNAKPEDQINFRQYMTCAPLPDTPGTALVNESIRSVFGTEIRKNTYFYGPNPFTNFTRWTLWANSSFPQTYRFDISSVFSNQTWETQDFDPVPGLMPIMADLTLIFLTNSVQYTAPFNETIFGTQEKANSDGLDLWYGRRSSVLACAHQYQFCNPMNGLCTEIGGWYDIGNDTIDSHHFKLWDDDGLTPLQHATISNIRIASGFGSVSHILQGLESDSLLAMQNLDREDGISLPLATNQTILELQNWFSTSLAALQDEFVLRPFIKANKFFQSNLSNSPLQDLCHRQLIRNTNYTSVSVLGLSIILAVGGFIILLSFIFPAVVGYFRLKLETNLYPLNEWNADELLRLQRTAFEGRDIGNWRNRKSSIPLTMPYEKFQLPLNGQRVLTNGTGSISEMRTPNIRYTAVPRLPEDLDITGA